MTRPYHSASSAKLGARCERAWAYAYLDGLRDADVAWEDVTDATPPRMRSLALGKAVHAVGEAHYGGSDEPMSLDLPGQIFTTGLAWLPRPSACHVIEVEHAIGDVPTGLSRPRCPTTRTLCGVRWGGFRDLLVTRRYDASWPVGLAETATIDYKTSSNIARYALTPETLAADVQAAIYAADYCLREGAPRAALRWVYMQTKGARRSLGVDTAITLDEALRVIEPAARVCERLDLLTASDDAEPNPDACRDYGGCPYHVDAGGPCTARMTLRSHYERTKRMPLDPTLAAKFAALPAAPPPPPAETAAALAPRGFGMPAAPPSVADTEPAPPPAEEKPKPRARKTAAAPPPPPASAPAPVPEGFAATIAALSAELTAADAAVAAAITARDAVVAQLREAIGGAQ